MPLVFRERISVERGRAAGDRATTRRRRQGRLGGPLAAAVLLALFACTSQEEAMVAEDPEVATPGAESDESAPVPVPDFEAIWDYRDPAETEARFRERLAEAEAEGAEPAYQWQLTTQLARTLGLQRRFDEAHRTLDPVEAALAEQPSSVVEVRYLLERGRVFNSSGQREQARPLFLKAWEVGREGPGLDRFAVDAAHMVAIASEPEEALRWNETAIAYAEASTDPGAKRWLGSLYNNIAWTYHDLGRLDEALATFEKALDWHAAHGSETTHRIAKWSVARALRSLGRCDEALERQRALLAELEAADSEDGYVFEELGECLLVTEGADEAKPWFAKAFHSLSGDPWLAENEAERLERLKELGGVE